MSISDEVARDRRKTCTQKWDRTRRGQMYRRWQKMISRCHYEGDPSYGRYGAKGVSVCDQWRGSFDVFFSDMGNPPDGYTLDRIDSTKGYSPENCRWADAKTQSNNRRNIKQYTIQGRTMNLHDWAKEAGFEYSLLYYRVITAGLSLDVALSLPISRSNCGRKGGLKGIKNET